MSKTKRSRKRRSREPLEHLLEDERQEQPPQVMASEMPEAMSIDEPNGVETRGEEPSEVTHELPTDTYLASTEMSYHYEEPEQHQEPSAPRVFKEEMLSTEEYEVAQGLQRGIAPDFETLRVMFPHLSQQDLLAMLDKLKDLKITDQYQSTSYHGYG